MSKPRLSSKSSKFKQIKWIENRKFSAISFSTLMLLSIFSSIQFVSLEVQAVNDQDGDGLELWLEYVLNTDPTDWDDDDDCLPDGWEYQHGLDPTDANGVKDSWWEDNVNTAEFQ